MGFMDNILGGTNQHGRDADSYRSIDESDVRGATNTAETTFHTAEITGQNDIINITEAVRDGDIVLADIRSIDTNSHQFEQFTDELQRVADETGSDIAQLGAEQIIITPNTIHISRDQL